MTRHRRHVVLIHRYFHPDTPPYASILREIARELGTAECKVTVLTCQPSYNRDVVRTALKREQIAPNVNVVRWRVLDDRRVAARKAFNLLVFCAHLVLTLPRLGRVDVVMAASTPPVLVAAVACRVAKLRGATFIYHKQDIYPEVTVGVGRRLGPLAFLLRTVDTWTDRSADRVVVLSGDMAKTIARRGVAPGRIRVINNFDPWRFTNQTASGVPVRDSSKAGLDVVFAGNIGRFQGLETISTAMRELRDDPVRFHFFGRGALSDELTLFAERYGLTRIHQYGFRPPDEVAAFLATTADLGIVSLAPGVIRAAYPSKTMSYLRQGTPILALVEGDSELAATIRIARIGLQVEPGDAAALIAALRALGTDPSALHGAPRRAQELYAREFDRDVKLAQWLELFVESAG